MPIAFLYHLSAVLLPQLLFRVHPRVEKFLRNKIDPLNKDAMNRERWQECGVWRCGLPHPDTPEW